MLRDSRKFTLARQRGAASSVSCSHGRAERRARAVPRPSLGGIRSSSLPSSNTPDQPLHGTAIEQRKKKQKKIFQKGKIH